MITYVDTSMLVKLLVDNDNYRAESEQLWLTSDSVICAEIGYVEARAALASAQRHGRLGPQTVQVAKTQLESLWEQLGVVAVDTVLVRAAADVAEFDGLHGYDAVHLAAALTGHAAVLASADRQLAQAARNRGLGVAAPP